VTGQRCHLATFRFIRRVRAIVGTARHEPCARVDTLRFEVRTGHTMKGGFRWLTVGPRTQPDLEIVLLEPKPGPMPDDEAAQALRLLLKKGVLGAGVFRVDDCRTSRPPIRTPACGCTSR
jgi:hypothetical protein